MGCEVSNVVLIVLVALIKMLQVLDSDIVSNNSVHAGTGVPVDVTAALQIQSKHGDGISSQAREQLEAGGVIADLKKFIEDVEKSMEDLEKVIENLFGHAKNAEQNH